MPELTSFGQHEMRTLLTLPLQRHGNQVTRGSVLIEQYQ